MSLILISHKANLCWILMGGYGDSSFLTLESHLRSDETVLRACYFGKHLSQHFLVVLLNFVMWSLPSILFSFICADWRLPC
mmetsp:Transcript_19029/g.23592  ORF Transcript_19029/g.23592 Transcript_19029/m.23592 type:complete len:81 (+) Transcript_19029:173-415(+)